MKIWWGKAMVCAGLAASAVLPAAAQQPQNERLITADGVRLDYPANGVWRDRARRVADHRTLLRSQGRMGALNAPAASLAATASAAAVEGDLWVPTILVAYRDTDTSDTAGVPLPRAASYDSILYHPAAPRLDRPYTQRTLYEEMSNGLLRMRGRAYGWMVGAREKDYYLEACGAYPTNALDCPIGRSRMGELFRTALARLDSAGVDFGQYDSDGDDGIPNSGDDDGYVDVVQFVQPVVGGECGGRGVWAHKFRMLAIGGVYSTNDVSAIGGVIKVDAYHLVGGVGGMSCNDATQIMGIGTASHELGHGLGLPDLYDTGGQTPGIGEWGLMGSANYRSLVSPGHFEAWSKERLGWVVVRELSATGDYQLGPVVSLDPGKADTVMLIRPRSSNPRGEYFLLENKQAVGSDTANMQQSGCRSKIGGLLVWHIDSLKIANGLSGNAVNAGFPHGVGLVQADGLGQLDRSASPGCPTEASGNRGDAGDPYPGTSNNGSYAKTTTPAAVKNGDGAYARFGLKNINQDVQGAMSFQFGHATLIRASDTLAQVNVSDVPYHLYEDVIWPGSAVTVSVSDPVPSADPRARFTFASWSDGGAREHTVSAATVGDTLIASLNASYQLLVSRSGTGTIATSPEAPGLETGTFFDGGTTVTLIPTSGPDSVFDQWSGDTISTSDTLVLTMRRPYTLSASFVPVLATPGTNAPVAIMGAPYTYPLPVQGGTGVYIWSVQSGSLPPGVGLFTDGRIGGTPEAVGTFDFTVRVRSSSQVAAVPIRLTVEAPVIALDAVVGQLLKLGTRLTEDEVRYFDLVGNRNTRLDLGDFLAWVKQTGIKPTAEVMARVAAAAKRETP